jgi:hypothetical protein
MKNSEMGSQDSENKKEKNLKEIIDTLGTAFEKLYKTALTILEPSGGLRENEVFIEGFENGMLLVTESETSPVMTISIDDVRDVELIGSPRRHTDSYIIKT